MAVTPTFSVDAQDYNAPTSSEVVLQFSKVADPNLNLVLLHAEVDSVEVDLLLTAEDIKELARKLDLLLQ